MGIAPELPEDEFDSDDDVLMAMMDQLEQAVESAVEPAVEAAAARKFCSVPRHRTNRCQIFLTFVRRQEYRESWQEWLHFVRVWGVVVSQQWRDPRCDQWEPNSMLLI